MRTKELLKKQSLTREEKIAHLKKLGLWREFKKELRKCDGDILYEISLPNLLESQISWSAFLFGSFIFSTTSRGHEFWVHVANHGVKPLKYESYEI